MLLNFNLKLLGFLSLLILGEATFGQNFDPPEIILVSIVPQPSNPGAVGIYWIPNPNPNVTGYKLYRERDDDVPGFIPIASILNPTANQYIDTDIDARKRSYRYFIESLPQGIKGQILSTVYLFAIKYDSCKMTNTLTWNHYKGWEGGAHYNVLDAAGNQINGGDNLTDSVFFHSVQADVEYTYQIIAVKNSDASFKSISNFSSKHTYSLLTPNKLNIYQIHNNNNTVEINTQVDNKRDLIGLSLMTSNTQNNFSEALYSEYHSKETDLGFSHSSENQPLYYIIKAINNCGDTVRDSEIVQPIVLIAPNSSETEVSLKWNSSYVESSEHYTIEILVDGSVMPSQTTSSLNKTINFADITTENNSEIFCFTIKANEDNGNVSTSNQVCASRSVQFEMPTAFSPTSTFTENRNFGPFNKYIKNAVIEKFNIIIYDKYGGVVFSADSPSKFWTGTSSRTSFDYVTEGGYIYYLEFTTQQGKSFKKSGTINVVYQ